MTLSDYFASAIRSIVPTIVGSIIAVLVKRFPGLQEVLSEGEVSSWLVPVCIGLYYLAVRGLEKKYPNFGWLLGLAKQPGYADAPAPPPQPAPPGDVTEGFFNDTIDEVPDAEEEAEGFDHETPGDLLKIHEAIEEAGMTPAAFKRTFGRKKR